MQLAQESEVDTPEYITEVLVDTGLFVFDAFVALAEGVLNVLGVGGSPEALVGLVLLVAVLRVIL